MNVKDTSDEEPLEDLKVPLVQATYQNVLPSKLRHGNFNVMPLMPRDIEKVQENEKALLKQVI